jgi:hypothetical protein
VVLQNIANRLIGNLVPQIGQHTFGAPGGHGMSGQAQAADLCNAESRPLSKVPPGGFVGLEGARRQLRQGLGVGAGDRGADGSGRIVQSRCRQFNRSA